MSNNDLVTTKDQLPATGSYAELTGHGDALAATELKLPYIQILQPLSKEVQNGRDGAKSGRFFNTTTMDIYDTLPFVLVKTTKRYVEWEPRDKGGKFVASHGPEDQIVVDSLAVMRDRGLSIKELATPAGNSLQETDYLYGLILNKEGTAVESFGVMSIRKTALKIKRGWMNRLNIAAAAICRREGVRPGNLPFYIFKNNLTSAVVEAGGNRWWAPKFDSFNGSNYVESANMIPMDSPILAEARAMRDMIDQGFAKVDESAVAHEAQTDNSAADAETPF